jgi:acetyl-CoA synthetase
VVLVEGAPNAPEQDRFWRIISEHRVSYLGVAPTIIRTMMPYGADQLLPYDLSCLRVFASSGEAWTPEAWNWLFENVGKSKLPILNMSGGTELVDILTCTVIHPIKPCSFSIAVPGMNAGIYDDEGAELAAGQVGELVVRSPCLGMTRSLWNDEERYIDSYWSKYPGVWHHGDFASRDRDGFWYIHGRSDDVMKIGGKRISPSEIEALVLRSDKIVEAAAVGSKDTQKGQKIVCACVLAPGVEGSEILADEVRSTVELGLGRAFRPKEIVFVEELPKTRNLKVLRRVIVAVFEGRDVGDLSSLSNPKSVDDLKDAILFR